MPLIPIELRFLAKDGKSREAFNKLCECEDLHRYHGSSNDLSWVIFYFLKIADAEEASLALDKYLELDPPRPSMPHSNILRQLGKIKDVNENFDLPSCIQQVGLSFREEDYSSSFYQSMEIPPLAETVLKDCFESNMTCEEVLESYLEPTDEDNKLIFQIFSKQTYRQLWALNEDPDDAQKSYELVSSYLDALDGFPVNRRSEIYSNILNSIIWDTHDKTIPLFADILERWGFDSFRTEDWQKIHKNENTYDSLAEKAISKYITSLKANNREPDENMQLILNQALKYYPKDETYLRYSAKFKFKEGKQEEGLTIYKTLLKLHNKYYLWEELAHLTDDTSLRHSCLAKALLLEKNTDYVGKIRVLFASYLINEEKFAEALYELNEYKRAYEHNGWRINRALYELMEEIPQNTIPTSNNISLYRAMEAVANEFVYGDLPSEEVVVIKKQTINQNNKRKTLISLLRHNGTLIKVNPNSCGIPRNTSKGSLFEAKIKTTSDREQIVFLRSKGILQYQQVTVDRINVERGSFHLTGENNLSINALMNRCDFTPIVNQRLKVQTFAVLGNNSRTINRIIDLRTDE